MWRHFYVVIRERNHLLKEAGTCSGHWHTYAYKYKLVISTIDQQPIEISFELSFDFRVRSRCPLVRLFDYEREHAHKMNTAQNRT